MNLSLPKRLVLTTLVGYAIFCLPAFAACSGSSPTWTAASISQTDVSACITAASAGDTINVPNGTTATWSTLTDNKGVTLACPGGSCTITTSSAAYKFSCPSGTKFGRITGFSFTGIGNSSNGDVELDGPASGTGCTARVDNNSFSNSGLSIFLAVQENCSDTTFPHFLADHNSFTGSGASEMIHNLGCGAGNAAGWGFDVVPGSDNMLIVEDNTFTCTGGSPFCSAIEAYYGAATTFRHNTLNFSQVDQHGTCGNIYARWWEIYTNTFFPQGLNQSNYAALRGGSGLFYSNSESGSNTGAGSIELTEDCSTGSYPIADQVGRGISQNSSPAYVWGNTGTMPVSSGNATYVQIGASTGACAHSPCDVVSTSSQPTLTRCQSAVDVSAGCPVTYTYTPFTYPDPLQGGAVNPVSSPAAVILARMLARQ